MLYFLSHVNFACYSYSLMFFNVNFKLPNKLPNYPPTLTPPLIKLKLQEYVIFILKLLKTYQSWEIGVKQILSSKGHTSFVPGSSYVGSSIVVGKYQTINICQMNEYILLSLLLFLYCLSFYQISFDIVSTPVISKSNYSQVHQVNNHLDYKLSASISRSDGEKCRSREDYEKV